MICREIQTERKPPHSQIPKAELTTSSISTVEPLIARPMYAVSPLLHSNPTTNVLAADDGFLGSPSFFKRDVCIAGLRLSWWRCPVVQPQEADRSREELSQGHEERPQI